MKQAYATVKKISKNTFAVINSANQCVFASPSEKKANNYLVKLLKQATPNG
jgi:hypothetical protein